MQVRLIFSDTGKNKYQIEAISSKSDDFTTPKEDFIAPGNKFIRDVIINDLSTLVEELGDEFSITC